MRFCTALLALSIPLGALRAAHYDLPAEWLDTHALTLAAGDTARVTGSTTHPAVNLDNLEWNGGTLQLVDCRLEAGAGRSPGGLPLHVASGQHLQLQQCWIQGVPTAIEVAGGEVHLSGSTLAATQCNIHSTHPASRLWLQDVNLCASETGLELDSVDTVLIEGALFLTNITGLRIGAGNQVVLRDCLFQGNEWGIRVGAAAQPPILEEAVDLVDSRHALVENLSPLPIDLANAHVDEPGMIQGAWLRTGVDPDYTVHGLKASQAPIIIDDDDPFEDFKVILNGVTFDGLPCRESLILIYQSLSPYGEFVLSQTLNPNETNSFCTPIFGMQFFRATSVIGEWEN